MTLDIPGHRLSVAEVGPDYIVVQSACVAGPTHGTLIITVDGRDIRRRILLPNGIDAGLERQPLLVTDTYAPAGAGAR